MSAEQGMTEAPEQHQPVHHQPDNHPSETQGEDFGGGSGGYELDSDGQRVPHGMGQSKSSRRRRRKRKGKGSGGDAAQASGQPNEPEFASANGQAVPGVQAVTAQPSFNGGQRQHGGQQNGQSRSFGGQQQNGQNAPGGTKRWKKKFRDRDRSRPNDNPGNQVQAGASQNNGGGFRDGDTHQPGNGGSFKRKGFGGGGKQQRGPRSFVGPMDHSYRVVNGNVFDGASTTEIYSNGGGGGRGRSYQGDSQPIDYSQGRAIPIPPDAPTRIYFFIEDLFFTAKIQETARKLGVKVAFVKNDKEQVAALMDGDDADRPGLIVFDLNNANAKPMTLIPKLKAKLKKTTSVIGFLSHLQGDLKAKAVEAGCDTVMPRAAFSQNLPNLLRRYGIEETEEQNFNQ